MGQGTRELVSQQRARRSEVRTTTFAHETRQIVNKGATWRRKQVVEVRTWFSRVCWWRLVLGTPSVGRTQGLLIRCVSGAKSTARHQLRSSPSLLLRTPPPWSYEIRQRDRDSLSVDPV